VIQKVHPALQQLKALGYKEGDRIYIRLLLPKNIPLEEAKKLGMAWEPEPEKIAPTPIDGYLILTADGAIFTRLKRCKDSGKFTERQTYQDGLGYLQQQNTKGYGVYVVVNAGGREDVDITRCPALFYECDGITKQQQWDKVSELTKAGFLPSLVTETRYSLHVYLATFEDTVENWQQLQQRLIQRQESDPSIHNPARLMRLAGFLHWRWSESLESFPVSIQLQTGKVYHREQLESFLPEWDAARWDKKPTGERIETDPSLDAFDIRNLAGYLDGYNPHGRRGWITCKCPAHNGRSDNSLHIEDSTGAFKCHAGCNPKEIYDAALENAKSRGYQLPERRGHSSFSPFAGIRNRLERLKKSPWGFLRGAVPGTLTEAIVPPVLIPEQYQAGDRLTEWAQLSTTHKYIVDTSGTGAGKSFDAGSVNPAQFDCRHALYVTNDPRNPSTPTLAEWDFLDGRHQGLARDDHDKWRRVGRGEAYEIEPNCGRVDVIGAIRAAGIEQADNSDLICKTCPQFEACRGGFLFGYLNARARLLRFDENPETKKIRSHPASLPSHESSVTADGETRSFPYNEFLIIWEEWTTVFKNSRTVEVDQTDMEKLIAHLATEYPDIFRQMHSLLTTLRDLLSGKVKQPNRYGWSHAALIGQLPQLPENLDLVAIAEATKPDLSFLNSASEYGVDNADLPAGLRKRFTDRDDKTAEQARTSLLKQWILPFLEILQGGAGYLNMSYGHLTITSPDERHLAIARAANKNIFLDATGHLEELALLLGVRPEEIGHIKQAVPPTDNLEVTQVALLGRLGQQRGDEQKRRVDAILNELTTRNPDSGVIRFKRFAETGQYCWFVESRGINDAQKLTTLILDGIPCENMEALAAEFTCIYGRVPVEGTEEIKVPIKLTNSLPPGIEPFFQMKVSTDPEFREFVRRRILANIHQAIGRLRANRRPDEQLKVIVLGDFPLDIPVQLVRARDITLEAASKVERVEMAIQAAVQQLKVAGEKVTQQAIAQITGISQGYVSRFRELLQTLLNTHKSKSNNSESPPDNGEWVAREYLPLVAESPEQVLEEVGTLIESYGVRSFAWIWEAASAQSQVKILTQLMMALPSGELKQLRLAAR
jgi:hypothetical protein